MINYYILIKSYLTDRHFLVKQGESTINLFKVIAGMPQGSIMNLILYFLFIYNLPVFADTVTGTFADDTAVLVINKHPKKAAFKLQKSLDKILS